MNVSDYGVLVRSIVHHPHPLVSRTANPSAVRGTALVCRVVILISSISVGSRLADPAPSSSNFRAETKRRDSNEPIS